jgi:hypothetical protein
LNNKAISEHLFFLLGGERIRRRGVRKEEKEEEGWLTL